MEIYSTPKKRERIEKREERIFGGRKLRKERESESSSRNQGGGGGDGGGGGGLDHKIGFGGGGGGREGGVAVGKWIVAVSETSKPQLLSLLSLFCVNLFLSHSTSSLS